MCSSSDRPVITERIVVEWQTVPAIGGYHPVAFYADGKPLPGSPDFELPYGGAVEIFAADPERIADAAERKWPTVLAAVSP